MPTMPLDVFDAIPGAAAATVTPLGGVAVVSTVQWFQEDASPSEQGLGAGASSALNRRLVAYVRRDEVPMLPIGSTLLGGPASNQKTWRVVSIDTSDPDYYLAVVV